MVADLLPEVLKEKKIIILGASNNPERYSNKAVRLYSKNGWEVFPVNPREGEITGLKCYPSVEDVPGDVHLVSVYVRPEIGIRLVPGMKRKGIRVAILNPGSESDELVKALRDAGIQPVLQCSIMMLEGLLGSSKDSVSFSTL